MNLRKLFGISVLPALLFSFSFSQNTGIEFFHGTWDQALSKAKSENKIIFVDAYTTWCGPCKWMAANTFTNSEVGAFYNKNFINVKLDMQSGEGPGFAQKYQIMAYPTLLFIDGTGKEVVRHMGAKPAEQFLQIGRSVAVK